MFTKLDPAYRKAFTVKKIRPQILMPET